MAGRFIDSTFLTECRRVKWIWPCRAARRPHSERCRYVLRGQLYYRGNKLVPWMQREASCRHRASTTTTRGSPSRPEGARHPGSAPGNQLALPQRTGRCKRGIVKESQSWVACFSLNRRCSVSLLNKKLSLCVFVSRRLPASQYARSIAANGRIPPNSVNWLP